MISVEKGNMTACSAAIIVLWVMLLPIAADDRSFTVQSGENN
jgi:hypothetical protein